MDLETKVRTIIEHIQPYIAADGGQLEFVEIVDDIVVISLTGACVGCGMLDVTLNEGVRNWIMDECPEIKDVVLQPQEMYFGDEMDEPVHQKTLKEIVDENLKKYNKE